MSRIIETALREAKSISSSLISISESLKELVKLKKEKMKREIIDEKKEHNEALYKQIKESMRNVISDEDKT